MDVNELLELEHRGWKSLCDGTGAEFYGEIMTEDGVMVLANGAAMDRPAVTQALIDAPTWDSFGIEAPRMIPAGGGTAVLLYRGVANRSGEGREIPQA